MISLVGHHQEATVINEITEEILAKQHTWLKTPFINIYSADLRQFKTQERNVIFNCKFCRNSMYKQKMNPNYSKKLDFREMYLD